MPMEFPVDQKLEMYYWHAYAPAYIPTYILSDLATHLPIHLLAYLLVHLSVVGDRHRPGGAQYGAETAADVLKIFA